MGGCIRMKIQFIITGWHFSQDSLIDGLHQLEKDNEKDKLNIPEYLVKITKFSTSLRQAIEYAKVIYDMHVRRELIKISETTIDNASNKLLKWLQRLLRMLRV